MFETKDALSAVARLQSDFLAMGAFLFVAEHGTPPVEVQSQPGEASVTVGGEADLVALLPTTDKLEVVHRIGTNGNAMHDSAEVVTWLRELDREQPFALLGAGYDFVEGVFLSPVADPAALATNIYSFCPDFWHQGLGLADSSAPEVGIANYFRRERYFYFWWD